MKCKERNGKVRECNDGQDKVLKVLYNTMPGRFVLKALVNPVVSKLGGLVLDSSISRMFISSFVRHNNINMTEYEPKVYKSYNDFFTRKIVANNRPISYSENDFIAPCDSKLTVYDISKTNSVVIKNTKYSLADLFKSEKLAAKYKDGIMLVFRLCVDDYHHYCYVDDGYKSDNRIIPGVLHTVNPIANDVYPIYKENQREYCLLKSFNFGTIAMMEVGALMVGKIKNLHGERYVCKGQEKGYFEFGGSTVVLCLQRDKVKIADDILTNSAEGIETIVKMGEVIGIRK